MLVQGTHYRTIWTGGDPFRGDLFIIDQTALPHAFRIARLHTLEEACEAISGMLVRGAGLIGAAAAHGFWLAALQAPDQGFHGFMEEASAALRATRPTAVNLEWALERQKKRIAGLGRQQAVPAAFAEACAIADEDADCCRRIGQNGLPLLRRAAQAHPGRPVEVLTHCNAGWLAFVDHGSALAPVYAAFDEGLPIHVWVDETRPRGQGAALTSWELLQHGVPHDIIADNAGGHLMQRGMVDMVITGADRVARNGDAANKIGTYLKALAAADNHVPFYVALPSSTFDFGIRDGMLGIPIEERSPEEVLFASGALDPGRTARVLLGPPGATARNWAFDVTPARLITGFITERGVCAATEEGIASMYPEALDAGAREQRHA
ncbi:MAG: S-methyl-5-thioribose-1-phosphate isomerase [Desulfovibrio sp.]|jgi:methylthioribose-1-phosphate isomerase